MEYSHQTKSDRLHDLADQIYQEYKQPIYDDDDEKWEMLSAIVILRDLAQNTIHD